MDDPLLPVGPSKYVKYDSTETFVTEITDGGFEELRPSSNDTNNLGYRIGRRRDLLTKRKRIAEVSFVLGVIGILLVIIDTELVLAGKIGAESSASNAIRVVTSISTIFLLISIIAYHATGQRLFKASAGFEDWRLGMTATKWLRLSIELLICFIHPLPFLHLFIPTPNMGSSILTSKSLPTNAILTILMFLRLYLFGRFVVLHNNLFYASSVQSMGALSRVKINASFVFKALLSSTPCVVLGTVMVSTIVINSWNIRLCEVYADPNSKLGEFTQAIWLTTVTFLTVGYGDIIPHSFCGRIIALLSGLMGVGIVALAVAVLAHNLEQSRSEKYIHTFVQQLALDKCAKNAASDVVKQTVRIWLLKKNGHYKGKTLLKHQSKLLRAKRKMQEAKFTKSHLSEGMIGPVELSSELNNMCDVVTSVKEDQKGFEQRIANLENLVVNMSRQLHDVRDMLNNKKCRSIKE
ncbi:hypothetical protein LOTGIDRAFT_213821 [Lottia gigantea]|uniref:Potassium channel domain-containing protein n=1 Tax=Lottia gigantea TaxID=225164 RepID=V4A2U8_LOTGI|nr:hypothetical protein LOTGIDRAFT_213821 [Lottia gigantea]ESO98188.1 hypothetical protein LOTGIDRAFT_213821 [Lottia gigantea]